MTDLIPNKKYLGLLVDKNPTSGLVQTGWGSQLQLSKLEVLRSFEAGPHTFLVFKSKPVLIVLQGGRK